MTTKPPILDERESGIFIIESRATCLIPVIGTTAWTVYTLLVQRTTPPNAADNWDTLVSSIADRCGLTATEVGSAIDVLDRCGLIEVVEPLECNERRASPVYRIVSVAQGETSDDSWARERETRMAGRRLFEALIDVCESDESDLDEHTRRQIISAVETIRSAGGNASQVYDAAMVYRDTIPGLPLTPRNLAMCWPMLMDMLPSDEVMQSP